MCELWVLRMCTYSDGHFLLFLMYSSVPVYFSDLSTKQGANILPFYDHTALFYVLIAKYKYLYE